MANLHKISSQRRTLLWLCLALLWRPAASLAQEQDLSQLGIEELMNIKVTSVAKTEQRMVESQAAVFVITQEDIRKSGMTSIPELLRMVPGLSVAQIDGSMWAISARGFNGQFANKLLVLIDGRSVYMPIYSGVYWEVQDVLLEDIDRIEVIRGPGAALWGANAVNGVINIITKHAQETQGGLLSSGVSSAEQRFGSLRYGSRLGRRGFFRVYGKYFKRDGLAYPEGERSPDGWDVSRGGFRSDVQLRPTDSLTWQGDMYHGTAGQKADLVSVNPLLYSINDTVGTAGGNLLARWNHVSSTGSDFFLQSYFDIARRRELAISQSLDTFDLEFQHHRFLGERHELVWGLGYRQVRGRLRGSDWIRVVPEQESTNLFSGFIQDEIRMLRGRVQLTLGSKFEHNDYTGAEVQPSVRLGVTLTPRHHLWTAVSRSVRTPSWAERGVRAGLGASTLPDGTVVLVALLGNKKLVSEKLQAYEAGYRWQAGSRLSLDTATYYNSYHDLYALEMGIAFPESSPLPRHLLLPVDFGNRTPAQGYGLEVAANVKVTHFWKLTAAETWEELSFHYPVAAQNPVERQFKGETPEQQLNLRSSFFLRHNLQFDAATFFVSRLAHQQVPAYTRFDLGLGWTVTEGLEFRVGAQNLLDNQHPEYKTVYTVVPTEIRRNVFARLTWRF